MKRLLLPLAFACLALTSVRADLIWYEPFDYPDGPINANSGGLWVAHSGTDNNALVSNHELQNVASRRDDVNRKFCIVGGCSYTNDLQALYASFTVNCTTLPTATNYFAHFINGTSSFYGRVFALPGSLPGTWRLGISAANTPVNQIYGVDLATNTDYQVVVGWNPTGSQVDQLYSLSASLWVNPISSSDLGLATGDTVTSPVVAQGYAFRQPSSGSDTWFSVITNLATATTFDEAATNVWATNAVAPQVVYSPQSATNFVGDNVTLSAVAAGQGLQNMTYQWQKNGADFSNPAGNANTLNFASAGTTDSGNYRVIATTPYGLSATSTVAFLWVTNPPVPPTVNQQPTNVAAYYGQNVSLYCGATGPDVLSYTWYHNNNPVSSEANPNVTGDGTPTLSISNLQTNNGTTGTYRCDVSNIYGTTPSQDATVSALPPVAATIGYLRGLVDPVYFLPTNTTTYWRVTGIVISKTNYTSATSSSFYMQDSTGGIDVFIGGGMGGVGGSVPAFGDSVTVVGPLGQFSSLLEMNLSASNPGHSVVINSNNNPVPPGTVLPLFFTNSVAYGGVSNALRSYQGSLITFTNVYFKAADGVATFSSGSTTLTNLNGDTFTCYIYSGFTNIIGQVIPQGNIWRITGPMSFFLNTAAADRSAGYEIEPSTLDDIVTTPPAAVNVNVSVNGSSQPVLTWTAEPFMSYTVLRSSVLSPNIADYSPVASGLTFNNASGQYTDTSASGSAFYKVISP